MEENKGLDPKNPKEAIQIIDYLTKNVSVGNRHETNVFNSAIMTLMEFVNENLEKNDK